MIVGKKVKISEVRMEEEEAAACLEVLKSGNLREGRKTRELEEAFAARTGAKHAIASSSGTSALHLAYLSALRPGDEVLVPAFTFVATASMIAMAGATPVFCDIDPGTWTIDPADAERKLTPRTRAIAAVHLFGNSCDIRALSDLASRKGLKIIWDAAQALGTRYDGRDIGAFEHIVCFSFYPSKNMTTGEGGMITTNDTAAAERMRLLKSHGQKEKYIHEIIGLNYRMSEIEAAVGLAQLRKLDGFLETRRKIGAHYEKGFSGNPLFRCQNVPDSADHSYNYFSIALQAGKLKSGRNELMKFLAEKGIQSAVHYPRSLHEQPCFANLEKPHLPVSERLAETIIALPMHPYMSEEDAGYVIETVSSWVHDHAK